ncbi:hypothetical protein FB451DRAFT_1392033 [Mycena latifolia]|nr:hypothetical protein FB451DRAFT_1392033 [Mycena latifolia]
MLPPPPPHIWLGPLNLDHKFKRTLEDVISLWLSRSLPYPLSFSMDMPSFSSRWSVVEIALPDEDPFAYNEVRGRLLCLKKLCLTIYSSDLVESFKDAPLLTEAYLMSGADDPAVILPWNQLTKLTCEDFTDTQCVELLRECSALVDCFFVGHDTPRSGASILESVPPVVQRHLTSLKIEGVADLDALRLLELPALRLLRLEIQNAIGQRDGTEILRTFLTRSSCYLETLCLWTYNEFLTEQLLHRLTFDLAVLPALKTLDIDVDLQYHFTPFYPADVFMEEMIHSRCLGLNGRSVTLETFRLRYKPNDDGDETGLMELASALETLVAPRIAEFKIGADSEFWVWRCSCDSAAKTNNMKAVTDVSKLLPTCRVLCDPMIEETQHLVYLYFFQAAATVEKMVSYRLDWMYIFALVDRNSFAFARNY